jgi:hypothetical protein
MARKAASFARPFQGRWRIKSMRLWDKAAVDLVAPGFIEVKGEQGEMRFIVVVAWLDIRYGLRDGEPIAEFSWEGEDEGDPRCGRGWIKLDKSGNLAGHIFFHQGDDSAFSCAPW